MIIVSVNMALFWQDCWFILGERRKKVVLSASLKKILWQLPHLPFIPHYPRKIHPTGGEMLYWMHKINFHLHLECFEGSDSIRESNNERMSFGHGTVFPWQGNRLQMVNVKTICMAVGRNHSWLARGVSTFIPIGFWLSQLQ